jgi:hypothetical protein
MIVVLTTACGCKKHVEVQTLMPVFDIAIHLGRNRFANLDRPSAGRSDYFVRRFAYHGEDLDGQPWYQEILDRGARPTVDPYSYDRLQRINDELQRKYDTLYNEVYGMDIGL